MRVSGNLLASKTPNELARRPPMVIEAKVVMRVRCGLTMRVSGDLLWS